MCGECKSTCLLSQFIFNGSMYSLSYISLLDIGCQCNQVMYVMYTCIVGLLVSFNFNLIIQILFRPSLPCLLKKFMNLQNILIVVNTKCAFLLYSSPFKTKKICLLSTTFTLTNRSYTFKTYFVPPMTPCT